MRDNEKFFEKKNYFWKILNGFIFTKKHLGYQVSHQKNFYDLQTNCIAGKIFFKTKKVSSAPNFFYKSIFWVELSAKKNFLRKFVFP